MNTEELTSSPIHGWSGKLPETWDTQVQVYDLNQTVQGPKAMRPRPK